MSAPTSDLRQHALTIWQAAVAAAEPAALVRAALAEPSVQAVIQQAPRIVVVGAGKAGAAMSAGVEEALHSTSLAAVTIPACASMERSTFLATAKATGATVRRSLGPAGSNQFGNCRRKRSW